jgi:hypothetical protein
LQKLSESRRTFLQDATRSYMNQLQGSPAAEYLANRRLLAPSPEKDPFLFGYVGSPLPGHEMFEGWMAIPYIRQPQGRPLTVVSIRFRCVNPECVTYHEDGSRTETHNGHGKYMTSPGDTTWLYNTSALLQPTSWVAITEGELDAATAVHCGIPTVGVPGAESWTDHFSDLFLGYETVYILSDGDKPGMNFARKVAGKIGNGKVLPWPDGEDTNSMFVAHGAQAIRDRIPE